MTLRRDFLGFTVGAVVSRTILPIGTAKAAPVSPDAELIAVCGEFDDLQHRIGAVLDGPDSIADDDAAHAVTQPLQARQGVLLNRMEGLRATTAAGVQARAHCLALHSGHYGFSFDVDDDPTGRMLRYLMRDAAAVGGSPPAVVTSPDADLMNACAAFNTLEQGYAIACASRGLPGSPEDVATDAECDRIIQAQDPLADRICELRAVTWEGMAARARSLVTWHPELMEHQGDFGSMFTQAILRDLIGEDAA